MSAAPRYETILKLASGGMATVWVGTVRGALGFRQLVAIKKPHPHLLSDPGFRGELVAEARLASMIRHANVVDVRDVEIDGESISLVMDFIEGASLGELLVAANRKGARLPVRCAVRIVRDACAGLHAAHELIDERDRPVGLVHRDVSPQNVLVGTDGIARVTDFGIAKFARTGVQSTSEGSLKGKLAYMAPEYVRGEPIDRRFDIFAMGVVLWEALSGARCFRGDNEADTLRRLLDHTPARVSSIDRALEPLDEIVLCALAKNRDERFQNAAAMGAALEGAAGAAGLLGSHTEVAAALKDLVGPALDERRSLVRAKLAHEPSVASLLGIAPVELPPLPKNTTLPMASAVPSTEPMTPPLGTMGSADVTVTSPVVFENPPAIALPVTLDPAIGGKTLRSEEDTPNGSPAPISLGESSPTGRRLLPIAIVAGLVVAAVAIGVALFIARPSRPLEPPPPGESSPVTAAAAATSAPAASAPPVAATSPSPSSSSSASASPSPATSAAPRPLVTQRPPSVTPKPPPKPAPATTPSAAPAPSPPAPAPTTTTKKPPDNPYL